MSRFSNLEFSGQSEGRSHPQATVKDEAFYLAEAKAAYEHGDFEPGLRAFARVLEYNPRNTAAWAGQVRMLIELAACRPT